MCAAPTEPHIIASVPDDRCLHQTFMLLRQIKFLSFLHAGQLRLAKRIGVTNMGDSADDFYQVLERAKREGSDAAVVFGASS